MTNSNECYSKFALNADIQDAVRAKTITQQEADAFLEKLKATDWKKDDADATLLDKINQGVKVMLQEFADETDPERWRFTRRDHIE